MSVPTRERRPRASRKALVAVPNHRRDFESHTLVAYHLRTRHGMEVELCGLSGLTKSVLRSAPDVLVLDYLTSGDRLAAARAAKEIGTKLVILPTAGFFHGDEDELRGAMKRPEVVALIDAYLAWGEAGRKVVCEATALEEERVLVTGCPRFDSYRAPLVKTAEPKADLVRRMGLSNPNAPIVVWPTNTSFTDAEHFRGRMDEPLAKTTVNNSRTIYEEFRLLFRELSHRHPDWNFVVKMHPSEEVGPYRTLGTDRENVAVVTDVAIRDVLIHCTAVVQRFSTTATEAWMLEKPVLEYERGEYEGSVRADYLSGNHVVADIDAADQALMSYVAGARLSDAQREARRAFLRSTYSNIDGRAAERCAGIIAALVAPLVYSDAQQAGLRRAAAVALEAHERAESKVLRNRVMDLLGLDRRRSLRAAVKGLMGRGADAAPPPSWEHAVSAPEIGAAYERFDAIYRGAPRPLSA